MRTIEIPYKPRNWAREFHDNTKRWIVMVLHRRAGKTTAALNHLQRDALRVPGSQYAYIGPTYKQSKLVAWDIAKRIAGPIPGVVFNESELMVKYPNASKLFLVGSENPDSLRGLALWGGAQDEASQQPSNLFSEIISKCLADHLGYWIWLGTPKGKNEFFKTYNKAKDNPDWTCIFKTIDDSIRDETGETIDNLKQALEDDRRLVAQGLMTEEEFQQEWYCSFEAAIKGAYYLTQITKARAENRVKQVPYENGLSVFPVWDLGVGQALGIGLYQRSGGEFRMVDYWEGSNKDGMPQAVKALKDKEYVYGKHFFPHDAQATETGSGKTRLQIFHELWPSADYELIPKMSVDDGINLGKQFWSTLWIDEVKCMTWLDNVSMYHQVWDDVRGMFKPVPFHDFTSHAADVHRYAAIVKDRMTNETRTPYVQTPVQPGEFEGENVNVFMGKVAPNFGQIPEQLPPYQRGEFE